jgi:hypothetical protein
MSEKQEGVQSELSAAAAAPEITVHNMENPAAFLAIGQMVVSCLSSKIRRAGVYVDEQGYVRLANPVYVHFDPRAMLVVPEGVKVRKVRPIITDGKPLLVIPDETGQLWEAEIEEEDANG